MKKQTTHSLSRRGFAATITGAAALVAGAGTAKGAASKATEIVALGKTGVKATRLAQGTGFNGSARSSAHTRLGEKAFISLVRHSLERGIGFMDTADLYGAHPYLRKALDGVSRDKYTLLSKLWPRNEFWNMASGGANAEVDRFRKELNSDVIEVCLIHCMVNSQWTDEYKRIRDELDSQKAKGAVKAVGVSCHDFGALKVACEDPWTDVVFARINNVGKSAAMDGSPEEVSALLKKARASGKAVIGMKIFGAGKLTTPAQMDASLKYVFDNGLVDAITIGMMKTAEVDDTIARVDKALKA
jgi:predicted aldo/keto reductase-like oxidoreductase